MPNYEFYLQMYSMQRQQQMESAISAAYNELMTEYKEEVRVQEMLGRMLSDHREMTLKAQKDMNEAILSASKGGSKGSGKDGGKSGDNLTPNQYFNHYATSAELKTKADDHDRKIIIEGGNRADAEYDLGNVAVELNRIFLDTDFQSTDTWPNLRPQLQSATSSIAGTKKAWQAYAEFSPRIITATGRNDAAFLTEVATALGVTTFPTQQGQAVFPTEFIIKADKNKTEKEFFDQFKADRTIINKFAADVKNVNLPTGLMLQQVQAQTTATPEQTQAERIKEISEAAPKIDTTLPPELQGFVPKKIATPKREDVLARAAELYQPYGSKSFQAQMKGEEPKTMRSMFMGDVKKEQQKKVETDLKSRVPEYMLPLVGLEAKVAPLSNKSMEELKSMNGIGYQYGTNLIGSGRQNTEQMMATIQADDSLTPEEREQAYTVIAIKRLQDYRKKKTKPLK